MIDFFIPMTMHWQIIFGVGPDMILAEAIPIDCWADDAIFIEDDDFYDDLDGRSQA